MESVRTRPEQERGGRVRRAVGRLCASALALYSSGILLNGSEYEVHEREKVHAESPAYEGDVIKVISANVHGWGDVNSHPNFSSFMEMIEQEKPDVVCLQEAGDYRDYLDNLYDSGWNVFLAPTTMGWRVDWLDMPGGGFRMPLPLEVSPRGNAVITPYNSEMLNVFPLASRWTETRNQTEVVIEGEKPILVTNMHLSTGGKATRDMLRVVPRVAQLLEDRAVVVMCGDFNLDPKDINERTELPMIFGGPLKEVAEELFTNRDEDPSSRIDYVLFFCGETKSEYTRRFNSDHRAWVTVQDISDC